MCVGGKAKWVTLEVLSHYLIFANVHRDSVTAEGVRPSLVPRVSPCEN